MSAWAVSVTMTGKTDTLDPMAQDAFAGALAAHHGSGGFNERRLDATLSVEAASAVVAARRGAQLVAAAAHACGLNGWDVVAVEAVGWAELERRNATMQVPELLGRTELMAFLGISQQRLSKLRSENRLPEPLMLLAATPVWDKLAIVNWAAQWDRRAGRRRRPASPPVTTQPGSKAESTGP